LYALKKFIKIGISVVLIISVCLLPSAVFSASVLGTAAGPNIREPELVKTFWDQRHTLEEFETLYKELAATYPDTVKLYSIGHTWEERPLWCLEISADVRSPQTAGKTPIALIGNIHGGEHESGESVAYTAWWLPSAYAAGDPEAKRAMEGYVTYVIPVMNPDGYVNSFYRGTRQNMRPMDKNGVGGPYSDSYVDLNGDGKIGQMYLGGTADAPPASRPSSNLLGYESRDGDGNGVFGDDLKGSNIDLNRTFDYLWNFYRPYETPSKGANAWSSAGPDAASEPEVRAIQNFLTARPPAALISAHTGIQCVLYPWCYAPNDAANMPASDIAFFETTAEAMRATYEKTVQTVRPNARFYVKQSYDDYPTSAELIDWAYGRLGTHAYTVEVYSGGTPSANPANDSHYRWDDAAWSGSFRDKWDYLGTVTDGQRGAAQQRYENVWIYTSAAQQRLGEAPPDQQIMGEGFKDCALTMIFSEPAYTPHADAPEWLRWEIGLVDEPVAYEGTAYDIEVSAGHGGSVSGGGRYTPGESVTVAATPAENFVFEGWYENDIKLTQAEAVYVFNAAVDRRLEARFVRLTPVATYAEVHSSARISLRIKQRGQLNFRTDSETYEFISANPAVVTVNESGQLTGVKAGTALVSIHTTDGSDLTSSVMVTVS
jgi:hypothetical protein